ncbi:phosphate transport ATP-binding protein PstB (TC 3.A.1.7.1) [Clostridium botulinum H04402 065]|uniref:phosphate ABC transporter ATP-binding protein n=1 Tax=Clostridium botulinum TaxID=1491 RepID=UPI0001F84CC1|nr:phosphate ABC transporter ATP-binding protein [Clostridium botulinum]NFC48518.1 phosphate ABC transporter ATP-binding protein [Clostridium botulinum]NFC94598.1 phosphate ABC transporter ATP-binding protein [Clostridium botulinum]NFD20155.1 phosphate ABC transporter ATP-binding protein [Clostridium botulinum]NFD27976.1 phosphate ABC transporter ATP-binding protein [Clostridium botulinum]NFE77598.1 phosphate ABC transporter ATP-binding protein [Clostridium botulinum]
MNILETNNLNVYLDKNHILKNLNLNIEKNKVTAIIGPSGCGKSTLLKTLNGIIKEEINFNIEGDIYFNGENTESISLELLRRKIGCVFQSPAPFPFSIYKNFNYVLKYYGIKDKSKVNKIIEEKLKLVGLYDEVQDNLNMSALKLSGGQQQRLCIGRALLPEPEILLMDEPCSALDIKNTAIIEKLLLELKKKYTILIVTHNLAQAKRISDSTIFMLNGEVIESGQTEKVFNSPQNEETKNYISGIYG